jgi:hypothetical protein
MDGCAFGWIALGGWVIARRGSGIVATRAGAAAGVITGELRWWFCGKWVL